MARHDHADRALSKSLSNERDKNGS